MLLLGTQVLWEAGVFAVVKLTDITAIGTLHSSASRCTALCNFATDAGLFPAFKFNKFMVSHIFFSHSLAFSFGGCLFSASEACNQLVRDPGGNLEGRTSCLVLKHTSYKMKALLMALSNTKLSRYLQYFLHFCT